MKTAHRSPLLEGMPLLVVKRKKVSSCSSVLPSKDRLLLRDSLMKRYLFLDDEQNFDRPEHPSLWEVTSLQEAIKRLGLAGGRPN